MEQLSKGYLGNNCINCPNHKFCSSLEFTNVEINGKSVPIPTVFDFPQVVKVLNDGGFKTVMCRAVDGLIIFDPSVIRHKLRPWLKHNTNILEKFEIVDGVFTEILDPDSINTRMAFPDDPNFKGKPVPTVALAAKFCVCNDCKEAEEKGM